MPKHAAAAAAGSTAAAVPRTAAAAASADPMAGWRLRHADASDVPALAALYAAAFALNPAYCFIFTGSPTAGPPPGALRWLFERRVHLLLKRGCPVLVLAAPPPAPAKAAAPGGAKPGNEAYQKALQQGQLAPPPGIGGRWRRLGRRRGSGAADAAAEPSAAIAAAVAIMPQSKRPGTVDYMRAGMASWTRRWGAGSLRRALATDGRVSRAAAAHLGRGRSGGGARRGPACGCLGPPRTRSGGSISGGGAGSGGGGTGGGGSGGGGGGELMLMAVAPQWQVWPASVAVPETCHSIRRRPRGSLPRPSCSPSPPPHTRLWPPLPCCLRLRRFRAAGWASASLRRCSPSGTPPAAARSRSARRRRMRRDCTSATGSTGWTAPPPAAPAAAARPSPTRAG
jgi:hypothetical protein